MVDRLGDTAAFPLPLKTVTRFVSVQWGIPFPPRQHRCRLLITFSLCQSTLLLSVSVCTSSCCGKCLYSVSPSGWLPSPPLFVIQILGLNSVTYVVRLLLGLRIIFPKPFLVFRMSATFYCSQIRDVRIRLTSDKGGSVVIKGRQNLPVFSSHGDTFDNCTSTRRCRLLGYYHRTPVMFTSSVRGRWGRVSDNPEVKFKGR